MTHIKYILIALVAVLLCACDKTSVEQNIDNARTAIADGDYAAAIASLDASAAQLSDSLASPSRLSEVAILYMVVDSHLDDSDSHLKALEAYRRAVKINADSVAEFISTLDPDDTQYIYILQSLSASVDAALDTIRPFEDEPENVELLEEEIP